MITLDKGAEAVVVVTAVLVVAAVWFLIALAVTDEMADLMDAALDAASRTEVTLVEAADPVTVGVFDVRSERAEGAEGAKVVVMGLDSMVAE